jgi:hypothetical protein
MTQTPTSVSTQRKIPQAGTVRRFEPAADGKRTGKNFQRDNRPRTSPARHETHCFVGELFPNVPPTQRSQRIP